MIQHIFVYLKNRLTLTLLLKSSFIAGFILLFFGYCLNSQLTEILNDNLERSQGNVLGAMVQDPLLQQQSTDNQVSSFNLLINPDICIVLPRNIYYQIDEQGYLSLVTKNIGLSSVINYKDLVYLKDYNVDTYPGVRLRLEPAQYLAQMFSAMYDLGLKPFVSSGYRTESDQEQNQAVWNKMLGPVVGSTYAANPGYSEHHLGTTVDIISRENDLNLLPSYLNTKVYKWLNSNAYLYGFVNSYPQGSEAETGYTFEPWHYRYVGIDLATTLHNENMLLQDYLYRINNYCLID